MVSILFQSMLTIFSHFYNEEYLLPWWLEHHKKIASHGIMIDYDSTDKSVEIIKDICPTWEIIKTKNGMFQHIDCDNEVRDLERLYQGYKLALNTTEFLVGNLQASLQYTPESLNIKSYVMCDKFHHLPCYPEYSVPLVDQCHHGFFKTAYRPSRVMHRKSTYDYTPGRHSYEIDTELLAVCWYGWAPWNEHTMQRKLQIGPRIPKEQLVLGHGRQHDCDINLLTQQFEYHASISYDLGPMIRMLQSYGKGE